MLPSGSIRRNASGANTPDAGCTTPSPAITLGAAALPSLRALKLTPSSRPPLAATPTLSPARRKSRRLKARSTLCGGMRISRSFGGLFDRGPDPHIGAATADIAGHRHIDVRIARLRMRGKQRSGRHDLAGLAVAALHDVEIEPCLLDLAARGRVADRFDCRDLACADGCDRRYARAHRLAIEMDGARATLRDAT